VVEIFGTLKPIKKLLFINTFAALFLRTNTEGARVTHPIIIAIVAMIATTSTATWA
jgi:hypothetical protein